MSRSFTAFSAVLSLFALLAIVRPAHAEPQTARFALILGVNRSIDPDAAQLRYADDDAAKYLDLFRGLGARTYLVSRLDANTARIHPQASAEAHEPTRAELGRALDELDADLGRARARGLRTVLYVLYSGHGNVDNGRAYLALEDARLFGSDLDHLIFDRIAASEYHVIVDACDSYLLAAPRGPGGKRRELHGFAQGAGIRPRSNLGLLFSTSSAHESHEWAGVEAGIFSHEVRSGLYGAADANSDGVVTYAEIAAFVQRANAAILSERFRPEVYARAPRGDGELVDLRSVHARRIHIAPNEHAHYRLENALGVQIAEFHSAADQNVTLIRPAGPEPLYLTRVDSAQEFALPSTGETLELAELTAEPSRVSARGAENHAFGTLFTLPFGPTFVGPVPSEPSTVAHEPERPRAFKTVAGTSLLGVGALGLAGGIAAAVSAAREGASVGPSTSQTEAAAINRALVTRRWETGLGLGFGAASIAGGVTLLVLPASRSTELDVAANHLFLKGRF